MATLSLLSRGNAQLVKTTQKKLEVHYEPEDYFNWRSYQVFHARRYLTGTYAPQGHWELPTPKTFSTRKGALVLYSEDLALPAWYRPRYRRRQKSHRRKWKSFNLQLNTLRDLTGAILAYGRKQRGDSESQWQPYLHFLSEAETQVNKQIRPGYSPKRYLTRLFQTWDPNIIYRLQQAGSLRDSVQLQQLPSSTAETSRRHPDLSSVPSKYQCPPGSSSIHPPHWTYTDVFTSSGHCSPVQEDDENEEGLGYKMEIPEELGKKTSAIPASTGTTQRRASPEQGDGHERYVTHKRPLLESLEGYNEMTNQSAEYSDRPGCQMAFPIWNDYIPPVHGKPHTTFYGGSFSGTKKYQCANLHKVQTDTEEPLPEGRFLPRIPQSYGPETGVRKDTKTKEPIKLPSLFEDIPRALRRKRRFHATDPPKELIIIPLMIHFQNQPTKEEKTHHRDTSENASRNLGVPKAPVVPPLPDQAQVPGPEGRMKTLQMDIDWNVDPPTGSSSLLPINKRKPVIEWRSTGHGGVKATYAQIDGDILTMPEAAPLGSLPPINGKKGPGNQSSMASLKIPTAGNSSNPAGTKGIPTGIIRGSIPEELKECCKGSSMGSLIMSPNGEIVCLSLVGAARDSDIPIQFDFIPEEDEEEEEGECLEPEDQEEQWMDNDPGSEQGTIGSDAPSIHIPTSHEDASTPVYFKEKKRPQSDVHKDERSITQQIDVDRRDLRSGESGSTETAHRLTLTAERDFASADEAVTSSRTTPRSTKSSGRASGIKEQDDTSSLIEMTPNKSPGRVTPSKDQMRASPQEIRSETPGRVTPSNDQMKVSPQETIVHQQPAEVSKPRKRQNKTERENRQNKPASIDPSSPKPEPHGQTLTNEDTFNEQEPMKQEIPMEETQDQKLTPTPSVKDEDGSKRKGEGTTAHGESKKKTSQKTEKAQLIPKEKNTEISVDETPSDPTENPPVIPPETEKRESIKTTLTEEEEMAILEKIASSVQKEAAKIKGKKKTKSQKPATTGAKKAKKGGDKQQGRAAFVVGQPKEKKPEGSISPSKKAAGPVERQESIHESIHETKDYDYEQEEELEKESEDLIEVETEDESPTPRDTEDPLDALDVDETSKDDDTEISNQAEEQIVFSAPDVAGAPDVGMSLALPPEDDYAPSEVSEATNSSHRQQKTLKNRELSEKAERRRIEVEKKRREREEQLRMEQEKQERMKMMEEELEQEHRRRAEEMRLKKQQMEEDKQRLEQEKQRRMQLEQQALERARQQQEEYRRKMQDLQRRKQQEELERIEFERQRQREKERLEADERRRMLEMADDEREEYKRKKQEMEARARWEEEERRKRAEEEAKSIMEEAQRQAQLLARQAAALEQQLQFNRGLMAESVGLDQTQSVSRAWVFSYFEFLELLGLPLPVADE
ncbi:uncharacterized protein KIAA2012 homolog [Discoglossus pictus]